MQAIQQYSRSARCVVWAIMAFMTAAWIVFFVFPGWKAFAEDYSAGIVTVIWMNLVHSLPVFILRILAFYQLEKLFRLYQNGRVFDLTGVRHIRLGGKLFLWSVGVEAAVRLAKAGLFIHKGSSPAIIVDLMQPMFGVGLALLIVGVLMLLVSRIMEEACRLSEEVELTV